MSRIILFAFICFMPLSAIDVRLEEPRQRSFIKKVRSNVLSIKKGLIEELDKFQLNQLFMCFSGALGAFLAVYLAATGSWKRRYQRLEAETQRTFIAIGLELIDDKTDLNQLREDLNKALKKDRRKTIDKYLNDPLMEGVHWNSTVGVSNARSCSNI